MTVARLHVCDGPSGDFLGQSQRLGIMIGEKTKRVDRLRRALNVDRVGLIVIISRAARGLEKRGLEIRIATIAVRHEGLVARVVDVTLDAVEIVGGVKIVDPVVFGILAIPPSTVR